MSQHDFNIANQGFPATRADINNAFQAIASNSSGATAPSTTYANMWWYDTTNDKMYLRNAADSAWIEVAVLDQTNNEWKITTGVVQAKDSDGLALKTDDGTTRLFVTDSAGDVGIGTVSPTSALELYREDATTNTALKMLTLNRKTSGTASDGIGARIAFEGEDDSGDGATIAYIDGILSDASNTIEKGAIVIHTRQNAGVGERARFTHDGMFGLGCIPETDFSTAYKNIQIGDASVIMGNDSGNEETFILNNAKWASDSSWEYIKDGSAAALGFDQTIPMRLRYAASGTGDTDLTWNEAFRVDSSGNLLVGKTTTAQNTAGTTISALNGVRPSVDGNVAALLNRLTSDGDIAVFRKDGTTVGSIGAASGTTYFVNATTGGIRLGTQSGQTRILPCNENGTNEDNIHDIGDPSVRWDDVYATNGTIQTSDQNEKQQIASLTDAEMTAAKAISKLFKTFKWNDSVTEKGDAARTHTGVIAQEVEQAMTDAGLNAGDYAFFISTTWWETQTEVPAVEAVEAQDAVYEDVIIPAVEEVLDEEGNVITEAQPERTEQRLVTEAVEGVEGKEAYTRTDTYHTLEEAPEGATERNRKGIRYPQLLSFIGAATEQRLASIESRLDALESA